MWMIYIWVGAFFGFLLAAVLAAGKIRDLQSEVARLYMENSELRWKASNGLDAGE